MPRIELDAVVLTRADRVILDGVSLVCETAGPTVIMGPNGAGKSVLLRVLHGLITPSRGRVRVDAAPLNRTTRHTQAMVFQTPILFRRTVRANIVFALRTTGGRVSDVAHWLEHAGLSDKADQPARSLSGGEAQRLALVRALACRPKTLFLDEPTSALDPAATVGVEALIKEAVGSGVQVIMVSHDMGQIRRLASDVVMMHQGRVVETGRVEDVLQAPQEAETRAYLNGDIVL